MNTYLRFELLYLDEKTDEERWPAVELSTGDFVITTTCRIYILLRIKYKMTRRAAKPHV